MKEVLLRSDWKTKRSLDLCQETKISRVAVHDANAAGLEALALAAASVVVEAASEVPTHRLRAPQSPIILWLVPQVMMSLQLMITMMWMMPWPSLMQLTPQLQVQSIQ